MSADGRAKKSFAEGKLTLSNASLLQENKKALEQNFDQIFSDAEKLSFRELENNLRQKLGRPKREVAITLPERVIEKIKRLKSSYGEDMTELEIFEALIDEKLNFKEAKRPSKTNPVKVTRYIPVATKALVMKRAEFRCEGIHMNGVRCNERRNLEIDHVKSFATGGSRHVANLQVLCRSHNQRKWMKEN